MRCVLIEMAPSRRCVNIRRRAADGNDNQLMALITDMTKKVHANEPETLAYYAIRVEGKDEIIFVEKYVHDTLARSSGTARDRGCNSAYRYKNQAAVTAHIQTPYFQEFAEKLPSLTEKPYDLKTGTRIAGFEGRADI